MAQLRRLWRSSDEGAIIIFAAMAMLVLIGFMAFAVDYGVFWESRGQAQNTADTAAMAAAVSWALDVPDADSDATLQADRNKYATESAAQVAKINTVWNVAPSVTTTLPTPPATGCPSGSPAVDCIKVDIFRDTAHGNALPVYFGHLLGISSQDIQASALAGVLVAGASDCLAPIALPDKFNDYDDKGKLKAWKTDAKFDKYDWKDPDGGGPQKDQAVLKPFPDHYVGPGPGGTGYKFTDTASTKKLEVDDMTLKVDKTDAIKVKDFIDKDSIKANKYVALDIPRKDGKDGFTGYSANFASCAGQVINIGSSVGMFNSQGKTADEFSKGYTGPAIKALYDADPNAKYKNGKITGSCAQANPPCAAAKNGQSPRLLNMPLYDPENWTDCVVGKVACDSAKEVKLTNVVGFFIDPDKDKLDKLKDGKFKGDLMPALGMIVSGPPIDADFAFLRAFGIVR
jgi:Flp pilus assembly protein TadG